MAKKNPPKKNGGKHPSKPGNGNKSAAKGSSKSKGASMQRPILDSGGVAYAQLLRDPCNAKLTGFYGGSSGFVQRFTSTFVVGTTAASTAGYLMVTPGSGGLIANQDVAGESTGIAAPAQSAVSFPGKTFLDSSAKGIRVLAGCVKMYSYASEQTRSGFLFYGNISAAEAPVAGSTPGAMETLVPNTVRTPNDCLEVRWAPGTGDVDYSPALGTASANVGANQAILIGWSGQPAAVGFKVVLTFVVEWLPNLTSGVTENAMEPPKSLNTIEHVKYALFRSDPNWWHRAGTVLYRTVTSAMAASTPAGALMAGVRALTY